MCNIRNLSQLVCLCFLVIQTSNSHSLSSKSYNNNTRLRRQSSDNYDGCILPQHPINGEWFFWTRAPPDPSVGMFVDSGAILLVRCKTNYKLDGSKTLYCENGKWSARIGRCNNAACPAVYSTAAIKVTCSFNNIKTENCIDVVDGAIASFKCAPFYEDVSPARRSAHICRNGTWNQPIPKCVPVCGKKPVQAQTLIIKGTSATKGDHPWQVALYNIKQNLLLCGGILLSERVILTAAHCITDNEGKLQNKEDYAVAVGKHYREYDDPRERNDSEVQFSQVEAMFIPDVFNGPIQNYRGDIAVIVTKKSFILSRGVQPVCVDWASNYVNELLNSNTTSLGYITGWGFTQKDSKPSDVLKQLKVPFVPNKQCIESSSADFNIFLTDDKLCAGYLNEDRALCKGDAGSGLVFKRGGRYYVSGIASVSPNVQPGGCNSQQYALYTKISTYYDFILEKQSQYTL